MKLKTIFSDFSKKQFDLYSLSLLLCAAAINIHGQTYTFTTCGATGQNGPNQGQVNSTYSGANTLNGLVTVIGQGIQTWTVPGGGNYKIETWGAAGGPAGGFPHFGSGASMEGVFNLTAGQVLKILVGQRGQQGTNGGCGGGGTFVADIGNTALIVAGGGSGGGNYAGPLYSIMDARTTNYGATYQTTGRATAGGGGGSFSVSGLNANGGVAFIAGGNGGGGTNGVGGFGGGGGSGGANQFAAGGGGYSGGDEIQGPAIYAPGQEGGGGSFNGGTSQVNAMGVNTGDGKVIITRLCNISLVPSKNPMCIGASITLTTNAVSGITWGGSGSTGNSILVTPVVGTTNYSVTGTSTANCQTTAVLAVTVYPLPVISSVVSPTTLCVGNTATINAIGANTYTWSTGLSGSTTTMNPGVTTTFSVTATSVYGCINSNTVSVPVNSNSITVSSSSPLCIGGVATIMASGAMSYTWSTGSMFPSVPVSPTVLTNYVVSGTDVYGCVLSNVLALSPSPLPDVSISASKNIICKGETVVLTALGATTFTWNDGTVAPSLTRTLPADVPYYYSVTGTDATGCSKTVSITITAAKCLGLNETEGLSLDLTVIPNPGTGLFNLQVNSVKDNLHMSVYNTLGMLIKTAPLVTGPNQLDLRAEKGGIYFIYVNSKEDNTTQVIKLINE